MDKLILQLERLYSCFEKFLDDYKEFEGRDTVLELYFQVIHFLNMYDCSQMQDEEGRSYYKICGHLLWDGRFLARLMCINPSDNLKNCLEKAVSTIFFSATLLPVNYYKLLLSGNVEDYAIYIPSPFSNENRCIFLGRDVSSKYTRRNAGEYERIAGYIERIAMAKKGNYMIFSPSYQYMEEMVKRLSDKFDTLVQQPNMQEAEREAFLEAFEESHEKSLLGFCVMGGIFSEGIDLTADRLIGAIIIGTGLPQVCMEKEVVRQYFEDCGMDGFSYAYRYPGMNKVLQAAGRVIRTESDKGVIALLDERFLKREYNELFPREWYDACVVGLNGIEQKVTAFWRGESK